MLFDMSASSNFRKIMLLNPDYPKDVTLKNTDGTASFSAAIAKKGRPDEYTYQWYVNGVAVAGATGATYVRNVSDDKGQYAVWCNVSNKAGTVRTREAKLTVYKLPVLNASYPANANIVITQSTSLSVVIAEDGYPSNYSYQWYVNGALVPGANAQTFDFNSSGNGTGNKTFCCVVSNSAGLVQSRTATVGVSASYYYSDGTFHYGGSFDWVSDSDTFKECGILNGLWYLKVDGGPHFGSAWGTVPVNLTGISKVIFTVSATYTSGHTDTQENIEEDIGWGRMGVVDTGNLGNTYLTAGTSVRMFTNYDSREFAVDVSHLTGIYAIKIVIDRTAQDHNHDELYIGAIRFE